MTGKRENIAGPAQGASVDCRSLLTWLATAFLLYELFSGVLVFALPFSVFVQYSLLIHTVIGLISLLPVALAVYLHWRRRRDDVPVHERRVAFAAVGTLVLVLLTGIVITWQGMFSISVAGSVRTAHLLASVALAASLFMHLVPIFFRASHTPVTPRRPARKKFALMSVTLVAALIAMTGMFTAREADREVFQAFNDDYDWPYGDGRPFWPSRAVIANPPWQEALLAELAPLIGDDAVVDLNTLLGRPVDAGIAAQVRAVLNEEQTDAATRGQVEEIVSRAIAAQRSAGALNPAAIGGSDSCGSSGCHETIYNEWRVSAHGYSADDALFLSVQQLLTESQGLAASRSCAGCHDPAALFSGSRFGASNQHAGLAIYEGNSCIVCHSTIATDTEGNGGFVMQVPPRYLFSASEKKTTAVINKFLIRSYPEKHVETYSRPLYKSSDFCAACHKQVPAPGEDTTAGLAQEQNEYDSWQNSPWYHGDGDAKTIECRECHMPLVDSDDPASGDGIDPYRSKDDGKHRSHRVLASNMYIPSHMNLPGAREQAELTIAWLQGKIDVPEIADRWVSGPVVQLAIDAPEEIRQGELINIKLHLQNHKTGHDFPAGPLDVLESWVELTVSDQSGNVLMQLGSDREVSPSIDAPVVYKADWYDRQGLPVEQHNLWDVVGASYKRVIQSGGSDVVDIPFRCPAIGRPRLSDSASETGPGDRRSDVVLSFDEQQLSELNVTARLLFRKANPQFLATVYDLDGVVEAPVIELVRATHSIRVVDN